MKKSHITLSLLMLAMSASAQQPFIKVGKSWHELWFNGSAILSGHTTQQPDQTYDYAFTSQSDTLINGIHYMRLFKMLPSAEVSGIYREEAGKVYRYDESTGIEYLYYDFTLNEGDDFALTSNDGTTFDCHVTQVTEVMVNDSPVRQIHFESTNPEFGTRTTNNVWTEGIGHSTSPSVSVENPYLVGGGTEIMQYVAQDSVPYYIQDFDYSYCYFGRVYHPNDIDMSNLLEPEHDALNYRIEDGTLHVFGYKWMTRNPNQYIYCSVNDQFEVRLNIEELEPIYKNAYHRAYRIDMRFGRFSEPADKYTFIDSEGEHKSLQDYVFSGDTTLTDNKRMHWEYDQESQCLTISGDEVPDYYRRQPELISSTYYEYTRPLPPWYEFKDKIKSIVLADGVTSIGSQAFKEMPLLESVAMPASLTSISPLVFARCPKLKGIELPEGITSIGQATFEDCTSLEQIYIPDGVEVIESGIFAGCTSLTQLHLPDSIISIENRAFYGCVNLKQLSIPNTVRKFTASAITRSGISELSVRWLNPMSVARGDRKDTDPYSRIEALDTYNLKDEDINWVSNVNLIVPEGTIKNYQSAQYWSRFSTITEDGVPPIDKKRYMLEYYEGLEPFGDVADKFYDMPCMVLPTKEVLMAFCDKHHVDTSSRAAVSAVALLWLKYLSTVDAELMAESATSVCQCTDDTVFIGTEMTEDFWHFATDACVIDLGHYSDDRYAERAPFTQFCSYNTMEYIPTDTPGCPYEGYMKISPEYTTSNPAVAYEIPILLQQGQRYKLSVVIAPDAEDADNHRANYFRLNWFVTNNDSTGLPYNFYKGSTKLISNESNSIKFIGGATEYDVLTATLEPTATVQRNVIQLQATITEKEKTTIYDRTFRIAEIKVEPLDVLDPTDTVYASIWHEGSEWEVYYEDETDGTVSDTWVRYNLKHVDNESYMALEKTVIVGGDTEGIPQLQGYIQNDGDSMIYVRPVSKDGVVGEKCLLYDFTTPYEYGSTLRYGVDGEIREEYINWHTDSLDYYMLIDGDTHCLPSWNGIVYRYGYLGGPMELFLMNAAPQKNKHPKPTNISHVIFSTKGGVKNLHDENLQNKYEVSIPYEKMLTDGTAWECLAVQTGNPGKSDIYNIQVKGDTIIGERHCKLVYSPEYDKTMTVFEEGRKVYAVNAEGAPEVLLDFGVQEKDVVDGDAQVACIEAMANQGYTHKTITIDTGNTDAISYFKGDTEPQNYYLIEGVGISKDQYLEDSRFVGKEETVSYLLRCWKGGVLVYQVPGYDPDGIEGVSEVANPHDGMLYDLQGRCLSTRPDKGFYISGNKKFIVR